jgi:hypothetical protein
MEDICTDVEVASVAEVDVPFEEADAVVYCEDVLFWAAFWESSCLRSICACWFEPVTDMLMCWFLLIT